MTKDERYAPLLVNGESGKTTRLIPGWTSEYVAEKVALRCAKEGWYPAIVRDTSGDMEMTIRSILGAKHRRGMRYLSPVEG